MIKKIRLNEIQEPVRTFLDEALSGDGVVIEDAAGQLRGRLRPFTQVSQEERDRALRELRALQATVQQRIDAAGKSEPELDAILQDDD
jgi:hypothetical protein